MKEIQLFAFGLLLTLTFHLVRSRTTPNSEIEYNEVASSRNYKNTIESKNKRGEDMDDESNEEINYERNGESDAKKEVIESCEVVRTLTEVNDNKENTERTVKCTCKAGKMAGTRREQPACVPKRIFDESKWCDMEPCLEHEKCEEMADGNGWKCSDDTKTKEVVIRSDSEENKTEVEDKSETGVVPKTED